MSLNHLSVQDPVYRFDMTVRRAQVSIAVTQVVSVLVSEKVVSRVLRLCVSTIPPPEPRSSDP